MSEEPQRDEILADAQAWATRAIAEGFDAPDAIIEQIAESLEEDLGGDFEGWTTAAVHSALELHLVAQATWPEETDCDRLDAAFDALQAHGIVARQNFSCCQTCGHAEIWDEIRSVADAGGEVRGYAFYHAQDTESAQEAGQLYLAYGAALGPDEPQESLEERALGVAKLISEVLLQAGFDVDWNGTTAQRIAISGLDWKRRRAPE